MQLMLDHVSKHYGDHRAVDAVSYALEPGIYGLLGVNGAGKSTLMRMICAILQPTRGAVRLNGKDVLTLGARYRQILGYLPQDFGFYPDLSVWDYVLYIAALKGLRPAVAKTRAEVLLDQVGLGDQHRTKMRALSGGMRRRVGIAQALLNDPQILVLDEPTSGLDPNERLRFRQLISGLGGDRLVLVSTHIVADVDYLANQLLLMAQGRFVATGTASALVDAIGQAVWEVPVMPGEVEAYRHRFRVANMRADGDATVLRIIAHEQPTPAAQPVAPTLEDVCLFYFKEQP